MKITFNGAARIVTGSCHLIETKNEKILVDCGLFQGLPNISELNYKNFRFDPSKITHVLLTHAHLDHCGLLPKLIKFGFKGKIWCTDATHDLCDPMLYDSAHVQKEIAKDRNENPLYDDVDIKRTMKHFKSIDYNKEYDITPNVRAKFRDAGHILGSAIIEVFIKEGEKTTKLVFSGDIGQKDIPIVKNPEIIEEADYLFIESTYGDRLHDSIGKKNEVIAEAIKKAYDKGGKLFIPSFAVERTQELFYRIRELLEQKKIPSQDVYLDSPLAIHATEIFEKHFEVYDKETKMIKKPFSFPGLKYTLKPQESKKLNKMPGPMIVIAGSGMCTGGRILHHFNNGIDNPKNTVLFVGYQAEGTLGREIIEGAKKIEIIGRMRSINAEILKINSLSGHADYSELLEWVGKFKKKPQKIFVVHGEEKSALSMKEKLEKLDLIAYVPRIGESVEI